MNHTELTANQNNFGIQISSLEINNKTLSLADQGISVSNPNSNTLMINSVIPTHININSSAMLNSTLNNQRPNNLPEMKNFNLAILAKPSCSSASSINSNLVNPLTFHQNNTIKLVNLSKCPQISNLGKDTNSTVVQSNTINVQIVSNTSGSVGADSSNSVQPNCKIESITLNPNSITTSASNQSVSTNSSSLTGTRFVIQGASPQFLPHGTLTFIPQTSDMANSSITNNHLIKNPKFVLAGNKHQNQTIRPISTGSISSVINQNNISKQPISIISPSKPINNFGPISAFNISDVSNSTVIQDIPINRGQNFPQRCSKNVTPSVKIPLQSYSVPSYNNNNIRLALTSGINNSRIHTNTNQSKIQLISPKSRKRSGSPLNLLSDGKGRNTTIGSKDEHAENSVAYNSQLGKYSPTRKRARKQHLNSVNTKSQKPIINQKVLLNNKVESSNHLNNIRPALNDKSISNTVIVSSTTTKVSNAKLDECLPLSASTPINALIITGIKNSIQLCPPKTSTVNQSTPHRPTSIYTNNACNNVLGTNSNSNATHTHTINQFQIISQNQNIKQIQVSQNFILSPKIKCQAPFPPSKVIHIAPSISTINKTTVLKNEAVTSEPVAITLNEEKSKIISAKVEKSIEPLKSEFSNIKSELSEESNVKLSLFPVKYQWNARRNHFMKKSDVKFKKSKPTSNSKFPSNSVVSEHQEDSNVNMSDMDLNDVNWFLYKAFGQIAMQKKFDEENLQKIYQLKKKFDVSPEVDDLSKPVFRKICEKTQYYSPIPDKIDLKCLSKYTDPHLFGIAEDIIDSYVNSLRKSDSEMCDDGYDDDRFSSPQPHECTQSCVLYSLEVPPPTKPQKFSKIIDLIEGLIVKEKHIIEKESEIKDQFLKYLNELSDFTSQNKNSPTITNINPDRFKLLTGYRR